MSLKFTDKQLNFGKILALESGHGLPDAALMTLTKASSVHKIVITPRTGMVKKFICHVIGRMLSSKGVIEPFDLYLVKGKNATSVYVSLRSTKFVGAYRWTPTDVKLANNDCLFLEMLETNLALANACWDDHQDSLATFKKMKKKNVFSKHTRTLRSLSNNYAKEDIASIKSSISNMLVNRW